MNPVVHVLRRMGGRATTILPPAPGVGLLFQDIAAAARPLLWPLAVVLLMPALARMDWARVSYLLRRPGLAILLSLAGLIVVPLAVWPVWQTLGLWPGLVTALCLSAMAPGTISAPATAGFLRLDSSLAVLMTLFSNFLVPFTLPPLALWLLGFELHISAVKLSLRLALIVVLAALGAWTIRRASPAAGLSRPRHLPVHRRRAVPALPDADLAGAGVSAAVAKVMCWARHSFHLPPPSYGGGAPAGGGGGRPQRRYVNSRRRNFMDLA